MYLRETSHKASDAPEIIYYFHYIVNGVDKAAATKDYSVFDAENAVYAKKLNKGKTSYVCLLSDKVFVCITLSDSCENINDKLHLIIDYALETYQAGWKTA